MAKNVAGASGACYSDAGVSLAIGNKNAVEQYFDTRFDIYNQNPPLASPSAAPPAVNVRKGYLPGHKSNAVDWCSATPASGSTLYYTYPSDRTVGAATQNSPTLTDVANPIGITAGEPVVDSGGVFASSADNPVTVSNSAGSTVTVATPASDDASFRRPHDRMDDERIARGRLVSQPRAAPRATASGIAPTIGPSIIPMGPRPRPSERRSAACAALRLKQASAATRSTDMKSA